jgi:hypothetical protein
VTISLDGSGQGSAVKTYNKTSYKGYLVPTFSFDGKSMAALMRYVPADNLPVGELSLSIQKYVIKDGASMPASFRVTRDKTMVVIVNITNIGTVPVGLLEKISLNLRHGYTIDDNQGFDQSAFVMVAGDASVANLSLAPGESILFNYTLRATKVGDHLLGATIKEFYFLRRAQATSNEFTAIVDEKPELIATYLGVSIGVTLLLVFGSIFTKKQQQRALEDFKRRDKILYDELTGQKRTYDEFLD